MSLIQQAFQGLAFDTFFDKKVSEFPFPTDDLRLELPLGAFNPQHIYIFNGSVCTVGAAQKVWWKRNYIPAKKGHGYLADNRGNNVGDPFYPSGSFNVRRENLVNGQLPMGRTTISSAYFYNIQDGTIVFSSVCRQFAMVQMRYNGTGCDIGAIPIIPLFLREAVCDFVAESTLRIRMAKEPTAWTKLWQIYDQRLNRDTRYGIGMGSWQRAEKFSKTLSASKREDFFEYYGRSQYEAGL